MDEKAIKLNRYMEVLLDDLNETDLLLSDEEVERRVDIIERLYKLCLDEKKIEYDHEIALKQQNLAEKAQTNDVSNKIMELDGLRFDTKLDICKELIKTGAIITFYAIWMKQGFKFEETGTYTSQTFRGLFSKFKPNSL